LREKASDDTTGPRAGPQAIWKAGRSDPTRQCRVSSGEIRC